MPNPSHTRHNEYQTINSLWVGFAFGAIAATSIAFFLGTKKGRELLKKIMEVAEDIPENALIIAGQIEEIISDKQVPDSLKQVKPILGNLLDKMKILKTG